MSATLAYTVAGLGALVALLGCLTQHRIEVRRRGLSTTTGRHIHRPDLNEPVLTFTAPDGQQITGVPFGWIDIGGWRNGKTVPIHYLPAQPEVFTADVTWADAHAGWVMAGLGSALLTGSALWSMFAGA